MRLAALADRFQMEEVRCALEDAAIRRLSVGSCAKVLSATAGVDQSSLAGLARVHAAARALATERLEAVAGTEGFQQLEVGEVEALLHDDGLASGSEETVALRAVTTWLACSGGGRNGGDGDGAAADCGPTCRRVLAGLRRRHVRRCCQPVQASALVECLAGLRAQASGGGAARPARLRVTEDGMAKPGLLR